jgi:hypothetical protein
MPAYQNEKKLVAYHNGKRLKAYQNGKLILGGVEILEISETSYSAPNVAGSFTFNIISNANWTVSSDQTWVTVSSTSGQKNATIMVNFTAQSLGNPQRIAVITVQGKKLTRTLTIIQAEKVLAFIFVGNSGNIGFMDSSGQTWT